MAATRVFAGSNPALRSFFLNLYKTRRWCVFMARMLCKIPEESDRKGQVYLYLVKEDSKDFHCEFGIITKEDLAKPDGTVVTTNTGKEMTVFSPNTMDWYRKVKRGPQMIPLKEIGSIIAHCGLGKDSIVVEGGAGSGGISCSLARICKEVISYDISEKHLQIVEHNKKLLHLDNLTLKLQNMTKKIDETDVDTTIIDLPSPWEALETTINATKVGGFIVSYSPNISQVNTFIDEAKKRGDTILMKTLEIVEREWAVEGRISHPISRQIIHSGFLVFLRRIR